VVGFFKSWHNAAVRKGWDGNAMKFLVRKAKIDPELRRTFEQYGVVGMQLVLGTTILACGWLCQSNRA
jgi:hypothetical protein